MCFSKRMSLGALAWGTLVNLGVAAYLLRSERGRAKKHVALRVGLLLGWQFGLLMQIPEAAQWHFMDDGRAPPSWVEPLAYWLNVLQPLAFLLALGGACLYAGFGGARLWSRLLGASVLVALMTAFAVVMHGSCVGARGELGIAPASPDCNHLSLHWWEGGLAGTVPLYCAAILVTLALLLPPRLALVQAAVFLGTLLVSSRLYACGTGSVWCWSIASAGLSVLAF